MQEPHISHRVVVVVVATTGRQDQIRFKADAEVLVHMEEPLGWGGHPIRLLIQDVYVLDK
jgi:hypothetical protein